MPDPDVPFSAPWQAQLFAMTVAMNEAGMFAWAEWASCFGKELEGVTTEGNEAYYLAWLRAFERFLVEKGHASADEIARITFAWHEAARSTPHGHPIELASATGAV